MFSEHRRRIYLSHMQPNDYVLINGGLHKIVTLSGTVRNVETQETCDVVLSSCHIPLTKSVLEACGFTQSDDPAHYCTTLQNKDRTRVAHIKCTFLIGGLSVEVSYLINGKPYQRQQEIGVLSKLQDSIRTLCDLELTIDEKKLAEAI